MTRLMLRQVFIGVVLLLALGCIAVFAWIRHRVPTPGNVLDEALLANRDGSTFPAADEDYFHEMDRAMTAAGVAPVALTPEEIKGRNTWIVWTGGNDRMWDQLSVTSFGALDLLKTISTYDGKTRRIIDGGKERQLPVLYNSHDTRWTHLGLINEPCFQKPTASDIKYRWGLRVDRRISHCPADPFENERKYPGVRVGSRGKTLKWRDPNKPNDTPIDVLLEVGSYYGFATGIVGLRLFPNPAFDQAAADKWDPERYYTDPAYYNSATLVKPYRVGMSCGFCHVGPNPILPPIEVPGPAGGLGEPKWKWENLSSNVGAQYFWVDRVLYWQHKPEDFAFHLFHSSRPGSLDTSFISTDNINNPRTMNAVYMLGPRLEQARRWGRERLAGGALNNRQFNDTVNAGPLAQFFQLPDVVWTPRILKDGSDSVGALGALNRVYLNIGTFSEEWLLHFNPLVGGKKVTPIEIATARRNSAYFAATEAQTLDMARFFLKTTAPHYLKDAPGGEKYLIDSPADVANGRVLFAQNCARCHSSKLPSPPPAVKILEPGGCAGKDYLKCWNSYWEWSETPEFKAAMVEIVNKPDFLAGNYLSSELRVPVTLLETNACSPLATNAIAGNIWDNFSSQSYKDLPSVGNITWYHPLTGERRTYTMPAGGRGYTRPPSLISLWSTAPFLLNNTVGTFEASPSVEARMRSFEDSIAQMLWPERRDQDTTEAVRSAVRIVKDGKTTPRPSRIDRIGDRLDGAVAATDAYLTASAGFLPSFLQDFVATGARFAPKYFTEDSLRLGPIPPGTPIGLLSNLNVVPDSTGESTLTTRQIRALLNQLRQQSGSEARKLWQSPEFVDALLGLSKCPDLIVNRGHYFGARLEDVEKRQLIAFLKTF